ncbi:MAG: thiamine-phosphate pyrophosphorylase [Dehalococcoidia bacterium]
MHPRILRTIDANINRISEGLRVLEDISRYIIEDVHTSRRLKSLRHQINELVSNISDRLIETRDVEGDIGSGFDLIDEHQDLAAVVRANAKRAQEGIRVLEEMSKLPDLKSVLSSAKLKESRYSVYSIEKAIITRLPDQRRSDKDGKKIERKRKSDP